MEQLRGAGLRSDVVTYFKSTKQFVLQFHLTVLLRQIPAWMQSVLTVVKNWTKVRIEGNTKDKGNFECFEGLSDSESSPVATLAMSMNKTDEASAS